MTHSKNYLNKFGNLSGNSKVLSVKPIVLFGPIQVAYETKRWGPVLQAKAEVHDFRISRLNCEPNLSN